MRKRSALLQSVLAGSLLFGTMGSTSLSSPDNASREENRYTLDDYIDAVVEIESSGNPRAIRHEPGLVKQLGIKPEEAYSLGLGQILIPTAREIEARHPELPRLGETLEEEKNSLFDPAINRAYTTAFFQEHLRFYDNDPSLAVAAYNSGSLTPRNARIQDQLNDLYQTGLVTDGILGKKSKEIIRMFQQEYELDVDGILGPKTYSKLQEVWQKKFPDEENPKGIVPINKYTPNHVEKFRKALED